MHNSQLNQRNDIINQLKKSVSIVTGFKMILFAYTTEECYIQKLFYSVLTEFYQVLNGLPWVLFNFTFKKCMDKARNKNANKTK